MTVRTRRVVFWVFYGVPAGWTLAAIGVALIERIAR